MKSQEGTKSLPSLPVPARKPWSLVFRAEASLIKSILAIRHSGLSQEWVHFNLNCSLQGASSNLLQEIFLSRDLPVSKNPV